MGIAIVDYCKGNLRSVQKGVEAAGGSAFISADPAEISKASALILPGVGAFADASATMRATGQMGLVRDMIARDVPFLGICLGLHLLFDYGCEGGDGRSLGLGVLRGSAERLPRESPDGSKVKIPHVGWNTVELSRGDCPLFEGLRDGTHFYFTHSYACVPQDLGCVVGSTRHGQAFVSAVRSGRAFGVQFHPEKSSAAGLRVLSNFVRLAEEAR